MSNKLSNTKQRLVAESMQDLQQSSLLSGGSSEYLDQLYESYLESADSVPATWHAYFDSLKSVADIAHTPIKDYFKNLAQSNKYNTASISQPALNNNNPDALQHIEQIKKQIAVNKLIVAYRRFGHLHASLDPLNLTAKETLPILSLDYYGFTTADLDREFTTDGLLGGAGSKLQDILIVLERIYSKSIGYQYQYITEHEELIWLQERIEANQGKFSFADDTKKNILHNLTIAEGIERYLGTKYVGQKRFSLEGGDSLIVMLDELIQRAGSVGFKDVVISMAHRGRLNVLINILGMLPVDLFAEFEGKTKNTDKSGDVKYHRGFSSDVKTSGGNVHLSLAFNPSHLEIVSPVAQGSVRARQDRRGDIAFNQVMSVSIHGDSAFAGQGVVMETFNMSQLRGFSIGGTVHIVINNQVGFTTNDTRDTRSTRYCTDIAKMIEAPVFHVNSDDPEAVLWVTQLALDYKHKFKKDVVIDLVCYRRHGHNEADEPAMTQPVMYQIIKSLPTTRALYSDKLIKDNILTKDTDQQNIDLYRTKLDQGSLVGANIIENDQSSNGTIWDQYVGNNYQDTSDTRYSKTKLFSLGEQICIIPNGFALQPQVKRTIDMRTKMTQGELPIDWGYAEMLAYASILEQGYHLRLTGQDSGRGTFTHRHAILHDYHTGQCYSSLQPIADKAKTRCSITDSFLSEEAVLAFEYGYSTTDPKTLNIWEAQFGDFVNGAQVVIDQFISSCEQKWDRLSGLVLLLPHGYEGQGPEHSSARLERFMQLCAEHNMQVCVPSTPAQVFHMFRRQVLRNYRKPLIVMSPKSLLRHKLAVSSLNDLANGTFQLLIPEQNTDIKPETVEKVVLCSGKVYYDLLTEREANKINNIAIIRIEQLYPFPEQQLKAVLAEYSNAKKVIWCQEEPKNQGAWYCSSHHLNSCLGKNQVLNFVGRESSSAPAVGYASLHIEQQNMLVKQAIN